MGFIRCLMTQKIPVCPGLTESLVTLHRTFPYGQGHSTLRIFFFYPSDNVFHPFVAVIRIFPSLQYKGPESQLISIFTAGKDLLFCQPVAFRIPVAPANTAVIAVIFTVIGKLNETSGIDLIPIIFLSELQCTLCQKLSYLRIMGTPDQLYELFFIKILILQKLLCYFLHDLSSPNRHSHPGNYIPCHPCDNR